MFLITSSERGEGIIKQVPRTKDEEVTGPGRGGGKWGMKHHNNPCLVYTQDVRLLMKDVTFILPSPYPYIVS